MKMNGTNLRFLIREKKNSEAETLNQKKRRSKKFQWIFFNFLKSIKKQLRRIKISKPENFSTMTNSIFYIVDSLNHETNNSLREL